MLVALGKNQMCIAEGTGVRFVRSFGEGAGIGGGECRKQAGIWLGTVGSLSVSPPLSPLPYRLSCRLSPEEVEGLALGESLSCYLKAKGFEIFSGEFAAMGKNENVGMAVV